MLNNHALDSPCTSVESPVFPDEEANILSEFTIGGDRYQVLVLDQIASETDFEDILTSLSSQAIVEKFSEITHFMVAEQLCLIVKICNIEDKENSQEETVAEIQALLTERELQIAALVAVGKVNKQIAKQLHISEWTVATYIRRMFAKFNVDSRAALVYRCAPLIRRLYAMSTLTTES